MKRGATLASLVACGAAGVVVAFALAATPIAGADGGTTGETTTAEPPPTTTTAPPPVPSGPRLIVAGTTVGGTLVGGLSAAEAKEVVRAAFARPLKLVVSPTRKLACMTLSSPPASTA